jgi:hypothetical protein
MHVLPEMKSNNSDLVLLLITANSIGYDSPVNDPFFSAHRRIDFVGSTGENATRYYSDWSSPVMGCQQRVRFSMLKYGRETDV